MAANSRIGAENLTIAQELTDVAGGASTYDTPVALSKKLMKVSLRHSSTTEPQYADDQTVDIYTEDGDIGLEINVTDLTEDELALVFGQTMVAGVRSPSPSDVRPYFCVMFKSKKRNGHYKYYKILKVKFNEPDTEFETKKEKTLPQNDVITGTGIQRLSDGLRKRVADEDATSWLAATGTNWFTSGDITPDTTPPTVTVAPVDGAANQAAAVNVVWTFDEPILPSCVTGANFFVMKDDGTAVAGALSIDAAHEVVTFNPTENLTAGADYISIATTGVKDKSGNALAAACVANFGIQA
jgi:phi13 family phage major tail protein